MTEEKHLIPANINIIKLFTENGLEPILNKIKKKVDEFVPDIETPSGRKEIASFAYKIAQSKTFIEKAGKDLVAKQKAELKLIDDERKRSRDFLDEQRDRARQPLTEWEEAEKKALEAEETRIRLDRDHTEALEFHALWLKEKELDALKAKIEKEKEEQRKKEEAERIEKERIEREDRLKKEAAAAAKKEAEEAAEREIKEAKEAVERAERNRIALEERTAREKQEAIDRTKREAEEKAAKVEADRFRKEAEERDRKEAERIAAEKKAANLNHKKRINNEALADLVVLGFDKTVARTFIEDVANGLVKHITINYINY